ncbi:hypothetical protein GCM10010124_33710 [Pilimelia terevasa]|uniref:Uncharacterized protein n=1 Tax=Pilimelia terevasa TaxID=53372 RepID=A0A8J3BUD5_9ACTN|nr:hypothetical protein [Pilimelia terevasa]GGK38150.1 hypothetical protein GCM10010124_33710 [Pilimelia terevasa]
MSTIGTRKLRRLPAADPCAACVGDGCSVCDPTRDPIITAVRRHAVDLAAEDTEGYGIGWAA